jgi:predicted membrane protein
VITYGTFFKLILPEILILAGISVIWHTLIHKPGRESMATVGTSNTETRGKTDAEYTAIFSGEKINFDGQIFSGTNLTAVFGSIRCDLRGAVIDHDVIINATAAFGSVEILLPPTVRLNVDSSSAFLGDVTNRFKAATPDASFPTVTIRPTCVFGSTTIK